MLHDAICDYIFADDCMRFQKRIVVQIMQNYYMDILSNMAL